MGRIILYLFCTLQISVPSKVLKSLQTTLSKFSKHKITHLHQLTHLGALRTFTDLRDRLKIPQHAHFSYLQMSHTITDARTHTVGGELTGLMTRFECKCISQQQQKRSLSFCYNAIIDESQTKVWGYQKEWHKDLGRELSPQEGVLVMRLTPRDIEENTVQMVLDTKQAF
ncbi:Hypothetical predicted protein [Pelobates cultripes]|uniref:Uncharacterized protein n=1 Tax=Pelobates cultripes TaxID=61616 RepID=A0AAD1TN99_PELCU|nr:Hypothetical predicted protein [Pelobates cultripes]